MIKGILFDKDGTLFDFNASWGGWARRLIDDMTADPSQREALSNAFKFDYQAEKFLPHSPVISGTSEVVFDALRSVFPDFREEEMVQTMERSARLAPLSPVCDLPRLLGELKAQGFILGVATNDGEASARQQLARFGIEEIFDFVAGYDSGYGAKPEPGMCLGFLEMQNLEPKTAIMVGDSAFDIRAGRAAQMRTIGVLTGAISSEELADADAILPDISYIPSWIAAENS